MKTICSEMYTDSKSFLNPFEQVMKSDCDWMEIRLDSRKISDKKEAEILLEEVSQFAQAATKPLILTYRTQEEGGQNAIEDWLYSFFIHRLVHMAAIAKERTRLEDSSVPPILVDVELARKERLNLDLEMPYVVLSFHDFQKTPEDARLHEIWDAMKACKPAIEKIACMPQSALDTARLLESCLQHKTRSKKIAISMAETGQLSRILADRFDSAATFVVLENTTAPGQLSLEDLQTYLHRS